MANNFRNLTITTYPSASHFYVNMNGSNLTGTGTPDNPFKSVQFGIDSSPGYIKSLVLGCGTYSTVWTSQQDALYGEMGLAKYTVLDMLGGVSYQFTDTKDITIKNGTLYLSAPITKTHTRVIFRDLIIFCQDSSQFLDFIDCEFINCTCFFGNQSRQKFRRCKIINSEFYGTYPSTGWGCYEMISTDVDEFSQVEIADHPLATTFINNNIRGNLMFQNGALAGVLIDLATAKTNYPSLFDTTNFSSDPLYNDVSKLSLTVQTGSPNLSSGAFGENVGNVFRALSLLNGISSPMLPINGATITDLIGTQDLTVNPLINNGFLITGTITINSSQTEFVNEINYLGKIATDSTFGGSSNSQVPDVLDYAIGNAGDNPPRLKYYARWHNGTTPPSPTIGSEWNNGGFLPAGDWSLFCFGEKPFLDSTFKGNGHQDFDDTDPSKFQVGAKWFQIWVNLDKELWNTI